MTNERNQQPSEQHPTKKIEGFDGELLHPSLDVKGGILLLGFRYKDSSREDKEALIVAKDGAISIETSDSFEFDGRRYYVDRNARKLARLEERWGVEALNEFYSGYMNGNGGATPNPRELFDELTTLAKKYVELEKDIDYPITVAWALGTYIFPTFSAFPFLNPKGPKRSGKSQCLNLLKQLCFNAIKARPSLPALADTVDALRGTYLIDQADSLERKGNEDLLDILADSYKKGGGKRRIMNPDMRKGREVLEMDTYSPKAFASIRELPEDLRDRCLVIPIIRSRNNFPDPDDENDDWREIRGKIYCFTIANHGLVTSLYTAKKTQYRTHRELLGRELELWLPLEVIFTSVGASDEIVRESKSRFLSQYGLSVYEPSEFEDEVIRAVLAKFHDEETQVTLSAKAISEGMNEDAFMPQDSPRQRAAKVGWTLKKFNLFSEKKPRTKEGLSYLFEKPKVEKINGLYFETLAHAPPTPAAEGGVN